MNSFEKSAIKKILDSIKKNQEIVLSLPTGKTPLPIYEKLIEKYKQGEIDFSKVTVFQLDELLGIPKDSKNSYQKYLKEKFLNHVNIKEKNCYFFDNAAEDYGKEGKRIENLIKEKGGIDLQILGVGKVGHIGFNEPTIRIDYNFFENPEEEKVKNYNKFILSASITQYEKIIEGIWQLKEKVREEIIKELPDKPGKEELVNKIKNQKLTFFIAKEQLREELELPSKNIELKEFEKAFNNSTHVEELSLPTIKSKAGSFDDLSKMPVRAITLGTGTILNSKKIIFLASGGRKAKIIKKTLEEPISVNCPASLLRNHSDTSFVLDEAAASLLSLKETKTKRWKIKSFLKEKYLSLVDKKRYLTIDLGGTYCRASLRDEEGKLLFSPIKVKTLATEEEEVILNQIVKLATPLLKIGGPEKTKILLATAGKVNEKKGIIEESRNLGLKHFPLKEKLKERLPFLASEIKITNDIVAAWHGEKKIVENTNFVSFYASTGIGGAFKNVNLEPGWSIGLSLDEEEEVKAARFLGQKEEGFYKKGELRKSEYFLEDLAGGPALITFAKDHASSFPKSSLAQRIKKGEVENIPAELGKKAKEGSSFARYCLKSCGKYAGIGIGLIYNHFYKSEDAFLDDDTKFFVNGSAGLDTFYFKGIKAGVKKANKLFEKELSLNNVLHSKFKDSTEGVQKGLVFYYQSLEEQKGILPNTESNILLSDKNLPSYLKVWPIITGREIIVLEEQKGNAEVFAGNLIHKLEEKNVVKRISINDWKRKKFNPDLILAPENQEIDFEGEILFYRKFPPTKEELEFNTFFKFNSAEDLLKSIRTYEKELERTRYDLGSKLLVNYYGELLKYFSLTNSKFAHVFNIKKVEKVEKKDIKGLSSIKNIIKKKKGKNIFISPHADDMEISAGALIKWMLKEGKEVENWIITESHNEEKRRKKEAEDASKVLSTTNNKLKLDFMGFDKENLSKEEAKDKIRYRIKDIKDLKTVFLPSPKDSHPTHQKVRKLVEEMFLEQKNDFLIIYYPSPWAGEYNTYYLSDKNYGKDKKSKIASLLKMSLGKSGILGELCGDFKEKGYFGNYLEQFKRN